MSFARAACAVLAVALVGCSSDPEPEQTTVAAADAFTSIVRWEIDQLEPVIDDDGNVEAPVIYLASGSGGTIDVRVQADVVAEIGDAAVIRFADDGRDAIDESLDNEPVKDDGVLIVLDDFQPDAATVEARIVRYRSIDDDEAWLLEVTVAGDRTTVKSASVAAEIPT
ncbi:hypothetical protein [Ilumatobacter sp.]|uniref:hypothetical protein n=1 Tax=Ilumatobacter sp. TaxID=1967498 RepID=UPI003C59B1A6